MARRLDAGMYILEQHVAHAHRGHRLREARDQLQLVFVHGSPLRCTPLQATIPNICRTRAAFTAVIDRADEGIASLELALATEHRKAADQR